MVKNKKTKKITKKSNNLINKINNTIDVPKIYQLYYNQLLGKTNRYKPTCEYKNIKFVYNKLDINKDDLFPYKFNIYVSNKVKKDDKIIINSIIYEVFISTILTRYTIRYIDILIDNIPVYKELKKDTDDYSNVKGFNNTSSLLDEILIQYKQLFINNV
jgi:hypothetical protein